MDWTQRALAVGESFSGAPCASLRGLLERQAAKFFRLFHHSNIEVGGWAPGVGGWVLGGAGGGGGARRRPDCVLHL